MSKTMLIKNLTTYLVYSLLFTTIIYGSQKDSALTDQERIKFDANAINNQIKRFTLVKQCAPDVSLNIIMLNINEQVEKETYPQELIQALHNTSNPFKNTINTFIKTRIQNGDICLQS